MNMNGSAADFWVARRFALVNTGGGCTAFSYQTGITHRVLVTAADDACIPESLDEPLAIGYYDDAAGEELRTFSAANSEQAFAIVVGERFAEVLRQSLSPDYIAEVKRRNAAEQNPSICHSHDICDANMAMHEAFTSFGVDPLAGTDEQGVSDEIGRIWSAAWNHAVVHHLGGRR